MPKVSKHEKRGRKLTVADCPNLNDPITLEALEDGETTFLRFPEENNKLHCVNSESLARYRDNPARLFAIYRLKPKYQFLTAAQEERKQRDYKSGFAYTPDDRSGTYVKVYLPAGNFIMVLRDSFPQGSLKAQTYVLIGGEEERFGNVKGTYGASEMHAQEGNVFRPYRFTKTVAKKPIPQRFLDANMFLAESIEEGKHQLSYTVDIDLLESEWKLHAASVSSLRRTLTEAICQVSPTYSRVRVSFKEISKELKQAYARLKHVRDKNYEMHFDAKTKSLTLRSL